MNHRLVSRFYVSVKPVLVAATATQNYRIAKIVYRVLL